MTTEEINHIEATPEVAFSVDAQARTIRGLAVPWGHVARSGGADWTFGQGSLQWGDVKRVKLLINHDHGRAVGYATELTDGPDGLHATFKVANGSAGDEALTLAAEGVYDGLSVGLGTGGKYASRNGVRVAQAAPLAEISLVSVPAFSEARITSVAMSADGEADTADNHNKEGSKMTDVVTQPEATEAPAFSEALEGLRAEVAALAEKVAAPQRQIVSAASGVQVTEEAPVYSFGATRSEHEFSADLSSAIRFNDGAAKQRLSEFFENLTFAAINQANVGGGVNPTRPAPELWRAPQGPKTPVADAILTGGLDSGVPFVVPTFTSSATMVNAHTEGTEPVDGAFVAGALTVTPSALSGACKITREVIDAGGSPQASTIIWNEMLRQWDIAKEAAAAAVLLGSSASEVGTAFAGTEVDSALDGALTSKLVGLAFTDYQFTVALGHVDLYGKLSAAKDSSGRRLYPSVNPSNASGSLTEKYQSLNAGGYNFVPANSLGATTVNKKSYLLDPSGVAFFMSAPLRISLPETVATSGNIGLFGYKAGAVLDVNRVRKLTY